MLWIYKKLFPKKYYILIFRESRFRCIVVSFTAVISFIDWNKLF
ncbi:DNA-binding protein [Bacillus cereus]|nr:DNA-binding protein [Bacillus mobilis]PEU74999.1 DNA-binding protein [Bacillus cereus]PGT75401.1 DNA-binding protein [Bacillus cereus]PGV94992.1 DNA-binding protein [Bacillus cereus]